MDWEKIAWLALIVMMLPGAWRSYQYHVKNSPKAKPGDWQSVSFVFGAVVLFVLLLVKSVQ